MSHQKRPKILITEGSSGSARETLYCLAEGYEFGLLDPDLLCQCRFSRHVHKVYRCPHYASEPAKYLRFLMDTVRAAEYDIVFPTHEQVYLLSLVRDEITREVAVALPDFESIGRMQCKSDFVRTLNELHIPVPVTRIVEDFRELENFTDFPCYVKLAHSTAGTGVALVNNQAELNSQEARFKDSGQLGTGTEILIQQPARGIMCVVQAVFQNGRLIAAHCAESLARGVGGGQGFRVSASHPAVVEYVRQLGEHLCWHGAMFLEYFFDRETHEPQFIECNPRIGETLNAKLCGVNLCDLFVRISLGEELEPVETPVKVGVRSYTDFYILLAQAMGGANRREIFREAWNMVRGRELYENSVSEITRPSEDLLSLIPAVATVLQMLLHPGAAHRLVHKSVRSFSLPQSGVQTIHDLSTERLVECTR